MAEALTVIGSFVLVGLGFLGTFLPILPGVPLAWLGILLYAYFTGFAKITLTTVLILFGLVLFAMLVDFVAPIIGAKKYNASKQGIAGAALGFLAGLVFLGPLGIVVGPLGGAFLGEILSGKNEKTAIHSAFGTFMGFLASSLIKTAIVFIFLGFLITAVF
jgi:uncharacterized protein YqgC (DUF456 family)